MGNRESRDIDRQTWLDARLRRARDGAVEEPLPEHLVTLVHRLADVVSRTNRAAPEESGRDGWRIGRGPANGESDGEHS